MTRALLLSSALLLRHWPGRSARFRRKPTKRLTAPAGELDLETWHTFATAADVPNGPASGGHRTMLRDRVRDHRSLGRRALQPGRPRTRRAGTPASDRARYRLALPASGRWIRCSTSNTNGSFARRAQQKLEAKLIWHATSDPGTWPANLAFEVERFLRRGLQPSWSTLSASLAARLAAFKLGLELFGAGDAGWSARVVPWLGPAISWATTLDERCGDSGLPCRRRRLTAESLGSTRAPSWAQVFEPDRSPWVVCLGVFPGAGSRVSDQGTIDEAEATAS